MSPISRVLFAVLLVVGITVSVTGDTEVARPYFALLAFALSVTFMGVYAFRPWRSTYAGRAAMLLTSAVALFTLNATAILWWPGGYGYPGFEQGTELVYVYLAYAILYKLLALIESRGKDPTA